MKFVQPIRDLDKLEEVAEALRAKSERNYMILVLGINTGFRVSDLIKLRVKDVKNKDHIILTEKKTGKDKRILITNDLRRDLKTYIQNKSDDEYLIKSSHGTNKALSRFMVYKILRDAAEKCGLAEIGTHTLRKTFGYHFYQKYRDVAMLMDLFNHSSEKVTLRYIGVNQDIIDRSMGNFRIRNPKKEGV